MEDFHRCLVDGIAVIAARASAIFTVNREKKREILLAIISKDIKYRANRMTARIVEDIISKENTTKKVIFRQ